MLKKVFVPIIILLYIFLLCGCSNMPELIDDFDPVEVSSENLTVYTYPELDSYIDYDFRNSQLLDSHYEKHGIDMGYESAEEYEEGACAVINNPNALHKIEAEDGDDIYYLEDTNEFVIVSTDGYIRTYFYPDKGVDYYNRQ